MNEVPPNLGSIVPALEEPAVTAEDDHLKDQKVDVIVGEVEKVKEVGDHSKDGQHEQEECIGEAKDVHKVVVHEGKRKWVSPSKRIEVQEVAQLKSYNTVESVNFSFGFAILLVDNLVEGSEVVLVEGYLLVGKNLVADYVHGLRLVIVFFILVCLLRLG